MARREVTQYFDDLDNRQLNYEELDEIHFGLDGKSYRIDLSKENGARFRELLEPYIAAGRVERPGRNAASSARSRVNSADVRRWANENGHKVAARGKIPQKVIDAYLADVS